MCKKNIDGSDPLATSLAGHHCKPGYLQFLSHCYKLFTDEKDWTSASDACNNGNHSKASAWNLASVNIHGEAAFLTTLINMTYGLSSPVWLGGKKVFGRWKWTDFSKFSKSLYPDTSQVRVDSSGSAATNSLQCSSHSLMDLASP